MNALFHNTDTLDLGPRSAANGFSVNSDAFDAMFQLDSTPRDLVRYLRPTPNAALRFRSDLPNFLGPARTQAVDLPLERAVDEEELDEPPSLSLSSSDSSDTIDHATPTFSFFQFEPESEPEPVVAIFENTEILPVFSTRMPVAEVSYRTVKTLVKNSGKENKDPSH
jgi:hypothetical protein